jgi:hypothetical protein
VKKRRGEGRWRPPPATTDLGRALEIYLMKLAGIGVSSISGSP